MDSAPKILIIDDDEDFRSALRSLLESSGYAAIEADSGKEGLKCLVEHRPDAILCDLMMESPVEGYSITYALRNDEAYAAFRSTPLFMISSVEESPDDLFPLSEYTDLIRPDRYMAKPIDIPRLLDLLAQAVSAPAAARRA